MSPSPRAVTEKAALGEAAVEIMRERLPLAPWGNRVGFLRRSPSRGGFFGAIGEGDRLVGERGWDGGVGEGGARVFWKWFLSKEWGISRLPGNHRVHAILFWQGFG